jgi:O-succinylbenzoic acid--CoA ligase
VSSPWTRDSARRWLATRVDAEAGRRSLAAFEETALRLDAGAPGVVIAHEDNAAYAGAWLAGATAGTPVWCANPMWVAAERAEAGACIPRGVPWVGAGGLAPVMKGAEALPADESRSAIFIPTGGTGGRIRFIRHAPATLAAAVSGFSLHAGARLSRSGGPARLHGVQALPCCHVSGLMPVVRAWLTDAEAVFIPPSFRADTPLPPMPGGGDGLTVVSLVAAQLHRLMERADGAAWLRASGLTLVGGSAVPPELLARARAERLPLGVSYGLTEAAALVALHAPEAFLRGDSPVAGEPLPHIRVFITEEGRVALSGDSLGAGLPRDAAGRFVTGDEGFLDAAGRLVVTGRADRILVSGGEKVDPAEVEAAIRTTGLVREVMVTGEPDPEWGVRLVALVVPVDSGDLNIVALEARVRALLAAHRVPRRWVVVPELPVDERGKKDQRALAAILAR